MRHKHGLLSTELRNMEEETDQIPAIKICDEPADKTDELIRR
jgi:hypothetical protein